MDNKNNKRNTKQGYKGKKPNRKTTKSTSFEKESMPTNTVHDQIRFDASNIFFNNIVGSNINWRPSTNQAGSTSLPGIITFGVTPNFTSNSDMLNVSATSIYTYVRHANSGRANYESSDLMLYLIQFGDIFGVLTHLIRSYGIARYFTSRNIYSGWVTNALGFDSKAIRNNLANYRYKLNVIISKLKSFAVPKTFSYFEEVIAEFSQVYLDEADPKAQMYAFVPRYLGKFNPTRETGGAIEYGVNNIVMGDSYEILLTKLDNLIDELRTNEDMNIISGDILKAYGDNLFTLDPIDLDFELEPVYDALKLQQIQNAHIVPLTNRPALIQENNRLKDESPLTVEGDAALTMITSGKRYLNSIVDDVDANFIFAISKYQVSTSGETISSAGLFILERMYVYGFAYDPNTGAFDSFEAIEHNQLIEIDGTIEIGLTLTDLTKFRSHPYVYLWLDDNGANKMFTLPIGDMHNVVIIDAADTGRMNDSRFVLSFRTPQMG